MPGCLQAVAPPWFGEQVLGVRRIRFELAAQLSHVHAEVVRLLLVPRPPELLEQLTLADQLAGLTSQELEQTPFRRGESDDGTGAVVHLLGT